jgi:hypothetical protein
MNRQELLDELTVERYRPVPCRPQDRIKPLSEAEQHRNRLTNDHEVPGAGDYRRLHAYP